MKFSPKTTMSGACGKDKEAMARKKDMPLLQAHRGVSSDYPENTMTAYMAAVEQGYGVIALDPLYTADETPVLLHDSTINRTGRYDDGR